MSGKKRNKFFFFIEEIVRDLKNDGLTSVNWVTVNNAAGDREWSKLDEAQRSVYAKMTRENKLLYDRNMTSERRERLVRVRAMLEGENERLAAGARDRRERRRDMDRQMREKLDDLPSGDALAEKTFFAIDAEYYVDHPMVPCELAVAEFSVKTGIGDVLHFFVDPGDDFPVNRAFDEKMRSEQVHGIPFLTRFDDKAFDYVPKNLQNVVDPASAVVNRNVYRNLFRDYDKLARLLHDFLTAKGTRPLPTLFTLDDRSTPDDLRAISGVERVKGCCEWLFERAKRMESLKREWAELDVLPLEQLLFAFHRHAKHGSVIPAETYFNLFVASGKWDFLPKSRCNFHDKIEARCTLGSVYKWCYALFDHLKKPEPMLIALFDFELTPNHLPKSTSTPFIVHTMDSLEESLELEEEASNAALSAITNAFSADLFSQLSLNDNFRPTGERDVNLPNRRIGLGRGTFLKKSVAQ